jgi:hypothetical protein
VVVQAALGQARRGDQGERRQGRQAGAQQALQRAAEQDGGGDQQGDQDDAQQPAARSEVVGRFQRRSSVSIIAAGQATGCPPKRFSAAG